MTLAVILFAVFASTAGASFVLQDRLIFPAPNIVIPTFPGDGFEPVSIPTPDGETLAAFYHPPEDGEATVLVFHGNGDAAIYQEIKGTALAQAGFGVLLAEYRGYAGSTGKPSEKGLFIDGRASYDFVREQTPQPIGLYAHSLGTAVAVNLASERPVFALVLESPFDSLEAVAQRHFPWLPVSLFLKHRFQSDRVIADVQAPLLMMHGSRDNVVPIERGIRLVELANSETKFLEIDGAGHNDLARFGTVDKAIEFLRQTSRR